MEGKDHSGIRRKVSNTMETRKIKKYIYRERELHVSENSDVLFVCFIFVTELLPQ